jgi:hypothetical protein
MILLILGEILAQKSKNIRIVIIFLLFFAYFLAAARPVPREAVLAPQWISSLNVQTVDGTSGQTYSLRTPSSGNVNAAGASPEILLPFALGDHFGYINSSGQFILNNTRTGNIALTGKMWAEYSAIPSEIKINYIGSDKVISIDDPRGYPVLLDDRIFIFGSEQNSLSEIDADGNTMWTYEYGSILTCIDVAAGLVLTGSIDGVIEILDSEGKRIYNFSPAGSRITTIYGCALSRDGSRIGVVSGIDPQRFILFERFGSSDSGEYRIIYHEFLDAGFRREVLVTFIDEDRRIIYERAGGIGCYSMRSRRGVFIPLAGDIAAVDYSGDQGMFFLVTSNSMQQKELVGIRFPQDRRFQMIRPLNMSSAVFLRAPFKSPDVFLVRNGPTLVTGGRTTLISFNLENK